MKRLYISGSPVLTHIDHVNVLRSTPPKYISEWGRADSIYHWIGAIVRLRERYWRGQPPPPHGIVIEVGRAAWLVALWSDDTSPSKHINGSEVDVWWPSDLDDLRKRILNRKIPEAELHDYVRSIDLSTLHKVGR